jgi:ADP-heptose:LPS heptosyltransferase
MSQAVRRMLIVNFTGIGNGICILPLLKRLEEVARDCHYYHLHNPVFDVCEFMNWFDLRNFLGTVPATWRRFNPGEWPAIKAFIIEHQIDVVVNLRNEGPNRDTNYFRFIEHMSGADIEFWQLDHATIANRREHKPLILDQAELLVQKGLDLSSFNQLWLRDFAAATRTERVKRKEIGFFTGASQAVKMWPARHWVELGDHLLESTDYNLLVYSGQLEPERVVAQYIIERLQLRHSVKRCRLIQDQSLSALCGHFSGLDLLISNDTSSVHIAAALGLSVIGLYFSTDSMIWGGLSDRFLPIQSATGLDCPSFKRDAGNCELYYAGCPAPCKEEVTPQRVYAAVQANLLLSLGSLIPRAKDVSPAAQLVKLPC